MNRRSLLPPSMEGRVDPGGRGDVTSCRPSPLLMEMSLMGNILWGSIHTFRHFNQSHFQLFDVLGGRVPPSCDSYATCLFFKNKGKCCFKSQEAGESKSRRCFDKNPYRLSKQPHCSSFSPVCSYRMTCTFELRRRR